MRENFEAQFEVDHDGNYLYRKNQKGEPIPVSAEERNRFARQYIRRTWLILAGMTAVLLGACGSLVWWTVSTNRQPSDVAIYAGIAGIVVVATALMYWVRGAPARELEGRTPVGRERSRDEMRAIYFERISYAQLAGAAAVGIVIIASKAINEDILSGWHRLWLLLGASLVLLTAVQALRKWRFEQSRDTFL